MVITKERQKEIDHTVKEHFSKIQEVLIKVSGMRVWRRAMVTYYMKQVIYMKEILHKEKEIILVNIHLKNIHIKANGIWE